MGKLSLDSNFDAEWKEEVESNVSRCGIMSELCEDEFLDNEIEKGVIVKCIKVWWLRNGVFVRVVVFGYLARGDCP